MAQLFLHRRGKDTEFIDVDLATTVESFCSSHDEPTSQAWLQDDTTPLEPSVTLSEVGVNDRCHIIVIPCQSITVKVRQVDNTFHKFTVAPSITVSSIFDLAAGPDGFGLTDDERVKHDLVIGDAVIDLNEHIGTLSNAECTVTLDLCPQDRFLG